jgi:hypothetical protein
VARVIWNYVSEFLGYDIGQDYLSVASKWIHKDKYYTVNTRPGRYPARASFMDLVIHEAVACKQSGRPVPGSPRRRPPVVRAGDDPCERRRCHGR